MKNVYQLKKVLVDPEHIGPRESLTIYPPWDPGHPLEDKYKYLYEMRQKLEVYSARVGAAAKIKYFWKSALMYLKFWERNSIKRPPGFHKGVFYCLINP